MKNWMSWGLLIAVVLGIAALWNHKRNAELLSQQYNIAKKQLDTSSKPQSDQKPLAMPAPSPHKTTRRLTLKEINKRRDLFLKSLGISARFPQNTMAAIVPNNKNKEILWIRQNQNLYSILLAQVPNNATKEKIRELVLESNHLASDELNSISINLNNGFQILDAFEYHTATGDNISAVMKHPSKQITFIANYSCDQFNQLHEKLLNEIFKNLKPTN